MNAIAGIVCFDGAPPDASMLTAPMQVMAHGAPEPRTAVLGGAAFACETSLRAPELAPDLRVQGELLIVSDARLDARDDLWARLDVPPAARATVADADLLLESYRRWGPDCPRHLIGDYAFAIWDRSARSLFAARDHVGARPFYYATLADKVVFASEIGGVLRFGGVPTDIDEVEVAQYLQCRTYAYFEPERTFFTAVHKLPFGHRMRLTRSETDVDRYWRPEQFTEVRLPSFDDYAGRLRELVERALIDRLRGVTHPAVHLSGGLDSSSLAVLASRATRARGQSVTALSWSPRPGVESGGSEHDRIAAVIMAERLDPLYCPTAVADRWRFDQDISTSPQITVAAERPSVRAALAAGADVIISGWGGDEAASYNGRGVAAEYFAAGRWLALVRHCRQRASAQHASVLGVAWREACRPVLRTRLLRLSNDRMHEAGPSVITPYLSRLARRRRQAHSDPLKGLSEARRVMLALYYGGVASGRLEAWSLFRTRSDVTHVYPLTDRRVLEFIYRAPIDLHMTDGVSRALFRQAMVGVLPDECRLAASKREEARIADLSQQRTVTHRDRILADLAMLSMEDPHPWVDVRALRTAVASCPDSGVLPVSVEHALGALTIWRSWCAAPIDRGSHQPE